MVRTVWSACAAEGPGLLTLRTSQEPGSLRKASGRQQTGRQPSTNQWFWSRAEGPGSWTVVGGGGQKEQGGGVGCGGVFPTGRRTMQASGLKYEKGLQPVL